MPSQRDLIQRIVRAQSLTACLAALADPELESVDLEDDRGFAPLYWTSVHAVTGGFGNAQRLVVDALLARAADPRKISSGAKKRPLDLALPAELRRLFEHALRLREQGKPHVPNDLTWTLLQLPPSLLDRSQPRSFFLSDDEIMTIAPSPRFFDSHDSWLAELAVIGVKKVDHEPAREDSRHRRSAQLTSIWLISKHRTSERRFTASAQPRVSVLPDLPSPVTSYTPSPYASTSYTPSTSTYIPVSAQPTSITLAARPSQTLILPPLPTSRPASTHTSSLGAYRL